MPSMGDWMTAMSEASRQMDVMKRPLTTQGDRAAMRAASAAETMLGKVESLSSGLEKERVDRQKSDDANMEYTKKNDIRNFVVAIIGAVTGVAGLIVSIIALLK